MDRHHTSIFYFLNLLNISNALNLSGIRFHVWDSQQEIVSVPNFTVRLSEDSNSWKYLRLYLLSLATNRSLIIGGIKPAWNLQISIANDSIFFWCMLLCCYPLILYQKGAGNHCKLNVRFFRECCLMHCLNIEK